MLIVFGGLPGVGKSTIARLVSLHLHAVYLRVDTIEQALRDAGARPVTEGYVAGYALARENLGLGATVVADSVNPLAVTRDAWRAVGDTAGVPVLEVEMVCSDVRQHRRRVETRVVDVAGLALPRWEDVERREYNPWTRDRLVVDTAALTAEACVDVVVRAAEALRPASDMLLVAKHGEC